jgi:hypothetical protein
LIETLQYTIDQNDKTTIIYANDLRLKHHYGAFMKNLSSAPAVLTRIALSGKPNLLSLFGKAAIKRDRFKLDQSLPRLSSEVKGIKIDRGHLKAYQSLCGFGDVRALPPTYLSMLGFPMMLDLMARKSFPMKAMGQVHLSNSISVHQSFSMDNSISLITAITDSVVTARGVEWVVDTIASVDDDIVWSSKSTMLYRCKTEIPRENISTTSALGSVQTWSVDSNMGRRYARVSGDYNPIHLSNITAKLFGFDQAIIHGMWSKARCLAALQDQLPEAGYRVIVNFQKPLFLPSNVLFYSDKESENTSFSLFSESGQYAHLDGLITGDLHNV